MSEGIDAGAIASNMSTPAVDTAPAAASESEVPTTTEQIAVESQEGLQPEAEQQSQQLDQDPDFIRRFNALARKEREIREREQKFKDRYGEYEGYQREREKIKENPLEFLESNGWSFQDLADFVLNNNKSTPDQKVSKLQQRIDQLEAERKKEIEDRARMEQEYRAQQTVSDYKANIKKEISANNEQFELINQFKEYDTVYEVIENYYNQNGVILEVSKAANEVEKYLESQFEKAASTSKLKKKFSHYFQPDPSKEDEGQSKQASFSEPSTLTNDVVSSSAASSSTNSTYLSDEESKRRAAEILREHILRKKGYTKT